MLTDFGKSLALLWLGVSCSYANEYPRVDAVKGTANIEFIDGEYFVKYVVYARNDDGKVESAARYAKTQLSHFVVDFYIAEHYPELVEREKFTTLTFKIIK